MYPRALSATHANSDNTRMNTAAPARWDGLLLDCRLASLCDNGVAYGAIEKAALAWKDGKITFAAAQSLLPGKPDALASQVESLAGAWITPGLIDCHTHLVFAGNRAADRDENPRRERG